MLTHVCTGKKIKNMCNENSYGKIYLWEQGDRYEKVQKITIKYLKLHCLTVLEQLA